MRLVRLAMRLACLLGLALAGLAAQAQGAAPDPAAAEAGRQLLVMLHLPKGHYRPDASYAGAYGDGVSQQARRQLAGALAQKHGLELQSDWPMPLVGVDCFLMRLPGVDKREVAQLVQALSKEEKVAWAQALQVYRAQATSPDPLYPTQPAAKLWRLAELHRLATGQGVRIAVIDSGIEAAHPDLAGQLALNENMLDGRALAAEHHGTAVAGIIAAQAGNGLGIAGIAPHARLLGLRACWQASAAETLCTSLSLAKALQAAVQHGAHIINMSLAGPEDRLLGLLIDQAQARGMTVVAALAPGPDNFPASHAGVLAVSDTPPVPGGAVLAPGRDVPSTTVAGGFSLVSGSSFAAAHVSGLLALLRELDSSARPGLLRAALVTEPAGRIDACATVLKRSNGRRSCSMASLGQTAD